MNERRLPNDDRLLELLADRATGELDDRTADELDTLLDQLDADDPTIDDEGLDLAAAAIELGALEASGRVEAMPEHLKVKLVRRGEQALADDQARAARPAGASTTAAAPAKAHDGWKLFSAAGLGWLAAAAAIVLAVVALFAPPIGREGQPDLAAARDRLLQTADDAVSVAWAQTTDAFQGVEGDVVWSDEKQEGYMRLVGMPVNDPAKLQYQLWIVDPDKDKHPVDGGVFDVTEEGEVIIPIHAKLPVDDPALFAITAEQPGGVVVSDGPLEVVAPVQG